MKVLVSDRYPPVRDRFVEMISQIAGVEVLGCAESGESVSGAVERLDPDVVVMDVGTRTLEELSKLRQFKERKGIPVVILCVDDSSFFSREKWIGIGADFVFHRSNDFKEVLDRLEKMARKDS